MSAYRYIAPLLLSLGLSVSAQAATETIVMIRHGEKPDAGLGQLNCRGLNRSLALPRVLAKKFGRPSAVFAPNPGIHKLDGGQSFNYIRPLATIEPTAVAQGMPVNTDFGYDDINRLQAALTAPALRDAMVFVAWEHNQIEALARNLLNAYGGNGKDVPVWKGSDFDGIDVISLETAPDGHRHASFRHDSQGLDSLPATCP